MEPEHLERLYQKKQANGSAVGTAPQGHRTLRTERCGPPPLQRISVRRETKST
ncbi:hypothetical protein [Streptomyces sp. NPDC056244]|uniref:hypothetical protein n=1 Tax=Streptomyces sp. NPDC056244 TaxID=3345762 RepID=UPI0035E3859D